MEGLRSRFGETIVEFAQHSDDRCCVAGHAEDVVVGADNGGAASMPVEPSGHHTIEFHGDAATDRFQRDRSGILSRTDANGCQPQLVDLPPGRVGQFEGGPAVDAKPPSRAESSVEQNGAVIAQYPGLRKQRAPRGFIGRSKQAFPQGRNDFLTGDGSGLPASLHQDTQIALACGLRVALANDLSDRFDPRGELADVIAALLAITIEQGFARLPMEDVIEFPNEIRAVAQTLAHALPNEGRLLMRRVAGEEDAAAPPLRRPARENGSWLPATMLLRPA
jgi:hypothetical protein